MYAPLPRVDVRTDFFAFEGGTDNTTPAMRMPPGMVIGSQNYEPSSNGGYARMKGYERFDGRTRPSSATYTNIACTLSITPAVGALVTIGAATGYFVAAVTGGCTLTGVSGTIPVSTNMTTAGPVVVGATAASLDLLTAITAQDDAQALADSADVFRALIAEPAGSGAIRGVVQYNGTVYCFRDNVGATAGQMYKSTAAGWVLVALGEEVVFSNANTAVAEGDTLTQGGSTATIARVVVETGTLASGVNTGRLVITGRVNNFAAGAATSTGAGALTLSGVQTAITLPAGGRYQFDIYNFYAATTSRRLYGVNGVGKGFEFDGTVFVTLRTFGAVDTPSYVKANRKYLYFGQGSSLINSSAGEPTRWVASEGAVEFGIGDTITGIVSLPGQALGVTARNSSFALVGSSTSDWVLQSIRADVGAVAYTLSSMSDTYMLDDRGVTSITAAQDYGNFSDATLSRKIQPTIDALITKVVGSYVNRQKGHYVLLMNDSTTLTMGVNNRSITGFMPGLLGFIPSCVWSGEDSTGLERIFIGDSLGMVYEMNLGSSFDGEDLEAFVKIWYLNSKSPRIRKRYRKMVLEMTAALYASLQFQAEYSYGSPEVQPTASSTISASGAGGSWELSNWDEFFWDAQDITQPEVSLNGTGLSMAMTFYSKSAIDFGHTLQGAIIHYTPRRLQR